VGITRAQEELQLSLARHRDFRGQRRMTVPSHFLMELPREEMELEDIGAERARTAGRRYVEPAYQEPVLSRPQLRPAPIRAAAVQLTTAAELANGGKPAPEVSPDSFHQGMIVRHPRYGLGRIVALSGAGRGRKATIDFPLPTGRKKFVLASSPLRPLKG
jgi:DNA helicase-2/ATP-dependent DNA helicase PcrA